MKQILLAAAVMTAALSAQTIVNTIPHGGPFAGGVAYDSVCDEVIVIDETNRNLVFYDRTTGVVKNTIPAPNTLPIGGHSVASTGNIFLGDENEIVYEIDRTGAVIQSWSTLPTINDVSALTMDPCTGNIWISNDSANIVAEFLPNGTPTGNSFAPQGSTDGDGIAYDPYNRLFYMGEDTTNQIIVVDTTGTQVAAFPVGALGISPEGLAIDTMTGSLFIGNGFVAPIAVYEVTGIVRGAPAGAVKHFGTTCGKAKINVSDAIRADGKTCAGFWVGFQSGQNPGGQALMNVDFVQQNFPLGFLGSNCTVYAFPALFSLVAKTNSNGRIGVRVPAPPVIPTGVQLVFWGADFDLNAPGVVPSASDGVVTVMQ